MSIGKAGSLRGRWLKRSLGAYQLVFLLHFGGFGDIHEGGVESVLSTQEYIRKVVDDVGEDEDFKGGSWVSTVEFVNSNGEGIVNGCLGDIKNYLMNEKLEQVLAIIKSYTTNALVDLIVTLKDLSSTILSTMNHKVIDDGGYGKDIIVFRKAIVAGSGNGVEDLYKFDEEALNLTLEEEARQAQAEQKWLEKGRQEEELAKGGGALRSSGALKPSTHPVIAIFMYPLEQWKQLVHITLSGHGCLFRVAEGGEALRSSAALKPSTHHVIAIFLYPLGVVEAACALAVDAIGAPCGSFKSGSESNGSFGSCFDNQ
nr:hypothetical protein [Tanacetum cinerariifolium]